MQALSDILVFYPGLTKDINPKYSVVANGHPTLSAKSFERPVNCRDLVTGTSCLLIGVYITPSTPYCSAKCARLRTWHLIRKSSTTDSMACFKTRNGT